MEYACALSGLVLVTANPAFQARELAYVLEQSGAVALFLVEEFRGNPIGQVGIEVAAGVAAIREVTDMESDALFSKGSRPPALPDVTPGDAAKIQYTSGTMNFPKGAVLSHRGLVNNARFYASRCGAGNHLGQHHADVPHLGLRHGHAWLPAGGLPEGAGQPVRSGCCAGSTGSYPCRYHPWRANHGGGTSGRARGASAGPVGPETGQLRRFDGGPGTGAPGAGADGRRVLNALRTNRTLPSDTNERMS